jgi:hypothetical protein
VPSRREGPPDPLGKRALFGVPPRLGAEFGIASGATAPLRDENGAIYPTAHLDQGEGAPRSRTPEAQRGTFVVECQRCSQGSSVGVLDLLRLQLPLGIWLPRGRFDRRMTCPACRKRSWCSVTLCRG